VRVVVGWALSWADVGVHVHGRACAGTRSYMNMSAMSFRIRRSLSGCGSMRRRASSIFTL
jgi:hypothetical protein